MPHQLRPRALDVSQSFIDVLVDADGHVALLRDERWAYIQYGEDASKGIELYDVKRDPEQLSNLANSDEHVGVVAEFKRRLAAKLSEVRDNDLGINYGVPTTRKR